jgi:mRNA-degrading endonuclease RelE of RelBE toxin-antitoxin system
LGSYRVEIKRSAEKEIERLPTTVRRLVVRRIFALADDPRPPGSQKLADDAVVTVTVVRVAHRSDVDR